MLNPELLSLEQIQRRSAVLRSALSALTTDMEGNALTLEGRFHIAVRALTKEAVNEALSKLERAERVAEINGSAVIDERTLCVARHFNRVGPARLAQIAQRRLVALESGLTADSPV